MSRAGRVTDSGKPPERRRWLIRGILRSLIDLAFFTLSDFRITGKENIPASGPLIVVANHFNYIDPLAIIHATRLPLDFLSGTVNPGAPPALDFIPTLWGVHRIHRGSASTQALKITERVLSNGGVLGIFPEGGTWAQVLRPPRPGAAYLSARAGVPILPVGIDGMTDLLPSVKKGRRATVRVRIGEVFGPFAVTGRGRERRQQLDAIGDEIMQRIAALIPEDRHGWYSSDPAVREAAAEAAIYPWATAVEQDFTPGELLRRD